MAGGRAAPEGVVPDPELVEQAKRRSFAAEYKARILAEATRPCIVAGAATADSRQALSSLDELA